MRVLWINNSGAGFADYVDAEPGTSVEKFIGQRLPGYQPSDYLIRVNRQPVPRDYVLQEGDRLTCTPVKVEGAQLTGAPARIDAKRAKIAGSPPAATGRV
jgi:sulfur carrier protein ThiS